MASLDTIVLDTDDYIQDTVSSKTVYRFPGLVGCLAFIHVSDCGTNAYSWHAAGADLALLLNPDQRRMYMMFGRGGQVAVSGADGRAKAFTDYCKEYPGTTYMAGPNADDVARTYFKVAPANSFQVGGGVGHDAVTVVFNVKDRSWSVD